jgi:hypothetical protein
MIFLLNFRQEILRGKHFVEQRTAFFVEFAASIKDIFDDPQKVIEHI